MTRILRDQKVSRIEFVANTGGLLGLCTGFSFVTFCEIMYQVTASHTHSKTNISVSPPQVSKWIQRYVRQLQRKALVYKQSFRRSTRREETPRENTEQEKLEDARSLTDFTTRQRGLAFKESLESSDFEKYNQGTVSVIFPQSLIKTIPLSKKLIIDYLEFTKKLRFGPKTIVGSRRYFYESSEDSLALVSPHIHNFQERNGLSSQGGGGGSDHSPG